MIYSITDVLFELLMIVSVFPLPCAGSAEALTLILSPLVIENNAVTV